MKKFKVPGSHVLGSWVMSPGSLGSGSCVLGPGVPRPGSSFLTMPFTAELNIFLT